MPRRKKEKSNPSSAISKTRWSDQFLDETIVFWEPRYGRKLTREDAREIAENLTGFFRVLLEWEREKKKTKAAEEFEEKLPEPHEIGTV
jgi:hypothetical protein